MRALGRVSMAATALAIWIASPGAVWAQDEHAGHHPADAPAAEPASPQPAQPEAMPAPGGQRGMMGGRNMPMQGMMDGGPMCAMMGGGTSMSAAVDQRLGVMRNELAITAAQAPSWNAYAGAMRGAAAKMDEMRGSMMAGRQGTAPMSLLERLDHHDRMLAAARDNLHTLRPALERLYADLSAEQKRKADTLLAPCGMMQPMPMGGMTRR